MKTVPFHTQHWELDTWQKLGFTSREDAEYWMWSSCGILCIRMAAEYFLEERLSTDKLIAQGKKLGAYTHEKGWSHAGLVELIQSLGLEAHSGQRTPQQITQELAKNNLVIVSIKVAFRPTKTWRERILFWKKYGGHLALVLGSTPEGFIVHHSSARKELNWPETLIPLAQFKKGYTGRAIVIGKGIR